MKRHTKSLMVGGLALCFVVAALLPFGLLTLPNPPQYQYVGQPAESGAYVSEGGGLRRLYPHPRHQGEFPQGSARVGPEAQILVRSRQYDDVGRYRLFEVSTGRERALEARMVEGRLLRLSPREPLPSGRYEFRSVQDSMYGEDEFYYFEVTGSRGAVGAVRPRSSWPAAGGGT